MTDQIALTVITKIKPEAGEPLKALLKTMSRDVAGNSILPFGRLRDVHFARFVVLDPATDLNGNAIPAQLVFLTDADGPLEPHLREIVDIAGDGLDEIYTLCEGYPPTGARTAEGRLAYLSSHLVRASAIYVNTRGRTVDQIRREAYLHRAIQEFLDSRPRSADSNTPDAVRATIQEFVSGRDDLRWALRPLRSDVAVLLRERLHLAGGIGVLILLSPLVLLALPVFLVLLRLHELRDPAVRVRPSPERIEELAALEDHTAQNQFSAVGFVKPGWFRRLIAVGILWLANFGARHLYPRADLAGVKTIHFARWILLDSGRRLLFASNYDGSLESYMDDFIDKVAWGLNAVFSNGVNYPRTNWLVQDGARDEEAFKDYIRTYQIPTLTWYAAYDQTTAANIENNAKIHADLARRLDSRETEAWLRRL